MTTGRCLAVTVSPVSGMWNSIRSSSHSRSLGNSRSALSISSMRRITCSSEVNASPSLPSRTYLAMSSTPSPPNWLSYRRWTTSYTYRPSWALVVDLMFQIINFLPRAWEMASASMVLPVPGSPLMSRGFWSTMAMFTARISSSEAT